MIVGTAGHVDHGKTSLVKTITGVDADRLPAEKARGITIELGFAYLPQPDGTMIGFVDVPGHERLVHTMLAGAHGIDLLLLVVAADDGVMPQTREHFEIATLLGLSCGAVVLTKIDAAGPDRVAEVAAEAAALLQGTLFAGSPVFPVSNVTGQGVAALVSWLSAMHRRIAPRSADRLFRLAVDRAFVLQGTGVVVTGTVLDGSVTVGAEVVLSPSGLAARVRSIHAQNRKAAAGRAGDRCALNLAGPGIERDAIHRGQVATHPSCHAPAQRIDALLRLAPGARGLAPWMPARLHHATAEVGARLVPLQDDSADPDHGVLVQLVLDRPIAARVHDRFVLRDASGGGTLGGGRFIDLRAPQRHRRTPQRYAVLAALALPDPVQALAGLARAPAAPVALDAFARDRGAAIETARGWCTAAGMEEWTLGGQVQALARTEAQAALLRVRETLARCHAAEPDLPGMGLERLRLAAAPVLPAPLFRALLRRAATAGWLALDGAWARLADHRIEITPAEQALWQAIRPRLAGAERFRPARVRDIAGALGEAEAAIRTLLRRLCKAGAIDEVAQDHFFLRPAVAELVRLLEALEQGGAGWVTAARFRDRLEAEGGAVVGRKVAIQVLDFLDRHGVTIRRGDLRRINTHRRDLFEDVGAGGRESSPVGRPDFKSGWGRATVPGGFDSHSLPPSGTATRSSAGEHQPNPLRSP